ncbi:MAG: hypothetical protein CVT68_02190 [Actinobacteria bacterium HGW-Actinobacteria-8]|nr:MAG: hypothetical protein CVT68_02190 [Actinobacteria bacterium HGW-Actinobacteria-8]
MGNSFHAAMNDIVVDDSARMSGRDFSEAHGAAVTRRVRTRRTVRAAGIGTVATASAGALAYTALQWDRAPQPTAPKAAWCIPWDAAVNLPLMGDDPTIMSAGGALGAGGGQDYDGSFHLDVTADALTVSLRPPAEEMVLDIVDHRLIGPDGLTDEPITVTFPSGRTVTLQLVWTDEVLEVGFGLGEQMVFGTGTDFPHSAPGEEPGAEIPEFVIFSGKEAGGPRLSGLLLDQTTGHVQAEIGIGANGEVDVAFRDGSSASFDAGDDGVATFDWAGYSVVSIDPAADSGQVASGAAVTTPVDATFSGPIICGKVVPEDSFADGLRYIDLVDPEQPTN